MVDTGKPKFFVICFRTADQGILPPQADAALIALTEPKNFASYKSEHAADEARVQKFVGRDALRLNFPEPLHTIQQFGLTSPLWPQSDEESSLDPEKQANADKLLHVLSIAAAGSREQAHDVLEALGIDTPIPALRNLRLLGHLEISQSGKRWTVVPPMLYEINVGSGPAWAIAGQRSPTMVAKLRSLGAQIAAQPAVNAPSSLTLDASDAPLVGSEFHIDGMSFLYAGRASVLLARSLAPIENWAADLLSRDFNTSLYSLRLHDGQQWRDHDVVDSDGLYDLIDPQVGGRHYIAYYDFERSEWLEGEFYGLKFLADLRAGRLHSAHYKDRDRSFAVLRSQRWPEIYERALVLASGMLPIIQSEWLIYKDIPRELAEHLTDKLHLKLE
jgi:hypothetical protein